MGRERLVVSSKSILTLSGLGLLFCPHYLAMTYHTLALFLIDQRASKSDSCGKRELYEMKI